jgi:bacterial/archaeal transporter family-2 protein
MSPATVAALAVLVAGAGVAFQATLLSIIGRRVGVLSATTMAAVVGLISIAVVTLLATRTFDGVAAAFRQPTWLWLVGGGLGIAILAVLTFGRPHLGTFGTIALLIGGQLAASVLIDSLGLFGVDRMPFTLSRAAGLVLLAAGAILAIRR